MRYLFYTHSLVSDWNHGNAHFLRGVMRELIARGHEAKALEPADGWSRRNLLAERGEPALAQFARDFPMLRSETYDAAFDHEAAASEADVVIVHEWTDPELVARLGRARRRGRFTLLFHDTHHRAVSAEGDIAGLSLEDYDAVLAFGETLRERYLAAGWGRRVFTWHEAADAALFRPLPLIPRADSLVWIGNWGDGERTQELETYLIEPVTKLGLEGEIYGVRYPEFAQEALAQAGLRYRGWLPNAEAPARFARHAVTVHVPRRPYVESLPGIPTIRMFEALACGIPLVSAPWSDSEGLFRPGVDFLMARDGAEMTKMLFDVVWDRARAQEMAKKGLETIRARHTCAHRVDELEAALQSIGVAAARKGAA